MGSRGARLGFCGGIANRADVLRVGHLRAAFEYGRAGNEHIGSGADDKGRGLRGHATIDLNVDRAIADECFHLPDLFDHRGNEGLAAEPGVYCHEQNEIETVEHVFDRRLPVLTG